MPEPVSDTTVSKKSLQVGVNRSCVVFTWPRRLPNGRFRTRSSPLHAPLLRRKCLSNRTSALVAKGKHVRENTPHKHLRAHCTRQNPSTANNLHLRSHRAPIDAFELVPVRTHDHAVAVSDGVRDAAHVCGRASQQERKLCALEFLPARSNKSAPNSALGTCNMHVAVITERIHDVFCGNARVVYVN